MSVGVDAHIDPAECNCKIAPYHRQNRTTPCRGGRPCPPVGQLRVCRNVSSNRTCPVRGERGIDPYKRCADSHWCIRVCGSVPPGGQGRPPLRVRACLHWCIWICNIVPRGRGLPLPRVFALLTLCTSIRTGRALCPTGCRSARRRAFARARRSCLRLPCSRACPRRARRWAR